MFVVGPTARNVRHETLRGKVGSDVIVYRVLSIHDGAICRIHDLGTDWTSLKRGLVFLVLFPHLHDSSSRGPPLLDAPLPISEKKLDEYKDCENREQYSSHAIGQTHLFCVFRVQDKQDENEDQDNRGG